VPSEASPDRWLGGSRLRTRRFCLAGVAGADLTVLTDPAGDGGSGVDITRVEISSYDEGGLTLSFWITVNGFFACSSDGDGEPAMVAVDLDENPDTRSAFYGTEVAFAPAGPVGDAHLLRADGWDFRGARKQLGLGAGCGPGSGGYTIDGSELGLKPGAGFNVVVAALGSEGDIAPDVGTFNYQQVPGTTPPALHRDRRRHTSAHSHPAGTRQARDPPLLGARRPRQDARDRTDLPWSAPVADDLDAAPRHEPVPRHAARVAGAAQSPRQAALLRPLDAAGNKSSRAWATLVIR
jgi:hypothetical protein